MMAKVSKEEALKRFNLERAKKRSEENAPFRCLECNSWSREKELIPTKKGYVCENCYEPERPVGVDEKGRKIRGLVSRGELGEEPRETNLKKHYKEIDQQALKKKIRPSGVVKPSKEKEIKPEEFLEQLKHTVKLNIPDAPPPHSPDLFRRMFDKWMKLLTYDAIAKYVITDRGGGKSKNAGLYLLYRVATENEENDKFYATFLMRNYDENTKLTRPQYEGYLDDFINWFYKDNSEKEKARWRLEWKTLYRAVEKDGRERIVFVDLYNPATSKKIDFPHKEIFFEESIPTKEQMLKDGGWIMHGGKTVEDTNYELVRKSASRGISNPRLTFLGNPNIPWIEIWFLNTIWEDELTEISKWYWSNTPKGKDMSALQKWRKWTWVKIYQKEIEGVGRVLLYLEKTEHEAKLIPSEEDWCWHNFFKTPESLNIVPFVNGSEPLWVFNGCICFWRPKTKEDPANTGYYSWIEIENHRYPNRDTIFKNIYEICINEEQMANNVTENLIERTQRRDKKDFQMWCLRQYKGGMLKFNSAKARERMLLFISKGKIII